ncbi:hypothetical protein B0H13DRAFT_1898827 [Mycena leptocephala]|nr:hypothetical protein B0H13DRAFT_1898827 [Mycena leptocephala]
MDTATIDSSLPPDLRPTPTFWINPTPSPPVPFPEPPSHPRFSGPPTDMDYKKESSKRRRKRKREDAQADAGTPGVKSIHEKRRREALANSIQVDINFDDLPHSKPTWISSRSAETGGRCLSIPITDAYGRIIAVLGGTPRDRAGWADLTEKASKLMSDAMADLSYSHRSHSPLLFCQDFAAFSNLSANLRSSLTGKYHKHLPGQTNTGAVSMTKITVRRCHRDVALLNLSCGICPSRCLLGEFDRCVVKDCNNCLFSCRLFDRMCGQENWVYFCGREEDSGQA